MQSTTARPATVDEYIGQFADGVQRLLAEIRAVVKESAPQAEERISYGMPGYYYKGYLVGFAAHKNHVGFYPTPSAAEGLKEDLAPYKQTKGSVHFLYNEPMPYDVIRKLVKFRLAENEQAKKR